MGNETSTPTTDETPPPPQPDASHRRYRTLSSTESFDGPGWLSERTTSVDSVDLRGDDVSASFDDDDFRGRPLPKRPPPRSSPTSRRRLKFFDGGSLKGNIAAMERQDESKKGFVDPILQAAAAGAKARKSKHAYLLKQQELERRQEEERRIQDRIRVENEWKSSLRRLASVAASTTKTVVKVTAPVLKDATAVVRESAKEFAQEVQTEWKKEPEHHFDHDDAESVVSFMSPGTSRYCMGTPNSKSHYDISPSATPNRSFPLVRNLNVLAMPTFQHPEDQSPMPVSSLFPHHSSPDFLGDGAPSNFQKHAESSEAADLEKAVESTGEAIVIEETSEENKEQSESVKVEESLALKASPSEHDSAEEAKTAQSAATNSGSNSQDLKSPQGPNETTGGADESENAQSAATNSGSDSLDLNSPHVTTDDSNDTVESTHDRTGDLTLPVEPTKSGDENSVIEKEGMLPDGKKKSPKWENLLKTFKDSISETSQSSNLSKGQDVPADSSQENAQGPSTEENDGVEKDDTCSPSQNNGVEPETNTLNSERQETIAESPLASDSSDSGSNRRSALVRSEPRSISGLQTELSGSETTAAGGDEGPAGLQETPVASGRRPNLLRSGPQSITALQDVIHKSSPQMEVDDSPLPATASPLVGEQAIKALDGSNAATHATAAIELGDDNEGTSGKDAAKVTDNAPLTTNQVEVETPMDERQGAVQREAAAPLEKESDLKLGGKVGVPVATGDDAHKANLGVKPEGKILRDSRGSLFEASDVAVYEASPEMENEIGSLPAPGPILGRSHGPVRSRDLFQRPPKILQFVLSKASEFHISRERGNHERKDDYVFDQRTDVIAKSVFEDEIALVTALSESSFGSISSPEVASLLSVTGSIEPLSEIEMGEAVFWDLYPPKHNVTPGKYAIAVTDGQGLEEQKQDPSYFMSDTGSGSVSLHENTASLGPQKYAVADSVSFLSDPLQKRPSRRSRKSFKKRSLDTANALADSAPNSIGAPEKTPTLEAVSEDQRKPESLTVGWENDDSESFPGVPETEDISEAYERDEVLDEALLAFSSLDDVGFLAKINAFPTLESVSNTPTSLLWRHLLGRWKHAEMWKAMIARPCTVKFRTFQEDRSPSDTESNSSASTSKLKFHEGKIEFPVEPHSIYSAIQHVSGFTPHTLEGDVVTLMGYVCDIGPTSFDAGGGTPEKPNYLQHKVPAEPNKESGESDDISCLIQFAERDKATLAKIVDILVQSSAQNEPVVPEADKESATSAVGIKAFSSIKAKAARKYDGDTSRVLDILRASIVFPDEGSLICGLAKLWNIAKKGMPGTSSDENEHGIEILRLKNLFRTSPAGNAYFPALYTGYRHILINIRLESGLIAGKFTAP